MQEGRDESQSQERREMRGCEALRWKMMNHYKSREIKMEMRRHQRALQPPSRPVESQARAKRGKKENTMTTCHLRLTKINIVMNSICISYCSIIKINNYTNN